MGYPFFIHFFPNFASRLLGETMEIIQVPIGRDSYRKAFSGERKEMIDKAYPLYPMDPHEIRLKSISKRIEPQNCPAFVIQRRNSIYLHSTFILHARIFMIRLDSVDIALHPQCCLDAVGLYNPYLKTYKDLQYFSRYFDAVQYYQDIK